MGKFKPPEWFQDEWRDGQVWKLVKDRDFPVSVNRLIVVLKLMQKRGYGEGKRFHLRWHTEGNTVFIQYRKWAK